MQIQKKRAKRRCRYVHCKVTSREVTGLSQECDKVLRYFEALFFVFIRRKVHFITVTLQRCYKYDDRGKAMRRYLDDLSEASVGETELVFIRSEEGSSQIFAMLVNCLF